MFQTQVVSARGGSQGLDRSRQTVADFSGQEGRRESRPVEFLGGALLKIGDQVRAKKSLFALP
jgi:hypothetical protein